MNSTVQVCFIKHCRSFYVHDISLVASDAGWKSLVATPGNRKRLRIIVALAFFTQWSGNGLVSGYLNKVFNQIGITRSSTQLLLNGLLQVWNLFWAVLAAFLVNRLGRRFLFLTSAGLMTLFYTAQTICFAQYSEHGIVAAGHAVVVFVFLFFAAYDIAFTPLVISYTVEILPFHLRAKGLNVFMFVVSLAVIFNQYVNPFALAALGWKYYVSHHVTALRCVRLIPNLACLCLLVGRRIRVFVVLSR